MQNEEGPLATIVATGLGFTITVKGAEVAEQLNALVSVTV